MKKYWTGLLIVLLGVCLTSHAGLVAHWTFDDSGNLGADSSGYGHDLVDYDAAPTWTADGQTNGAAVFDGSTSGYETTSMVTNSSFTVMVWVRPDVWSSSNYTYIVRHWSSSDNGFNFYGSGGKLYLTTLGVSSDTFVNSGYYPVTNQWQHFAFSFEPVSGPDGNGDYTGTVKGYINGALTVTQSNAVFRPVAGSVTMSVGRYGTYYYDGIMDDLRVYDQTLTDSEINTVYMESKSPLVGHYTFDDSGNLGADSSGYGHDLSDYGAAPGYSADGAIDGAAVFDGSTSGFEVTGFVSGGDFTAAMWIKPDVWDTASVVIRHWSSIHGINIYGAWVDEVAVAVLSETAGATYIRPYYNPVTNQWQHLSVTFEASSGPDANDEYIGTARFYVNGVLENTTSNVTYQPAAVDSKVMGIGRYSSSYYDGMMDDLRIYDKALALSDIQALYIAGVDPLIAHYTFDDSGNLGADSSGNGNDLEVYGTAPAYSAQGITNGAAVFDGSSTGFKLASANIMLNGDFTVAMWIKPDVWDSGSYLLRYWTSGDAGFNLYSAWDPAEIAFAVLAPVSADTYLRPRYTPAAGRWQHLALSFEASSGPDANGEYTGNLTAYIDGEVVATNSSAQYAPVTSSSTALSIGRYSTYYYDGLIDDIRIYIKPLTGSEIQALASIAPPPGYDNWAAGWGVDIGAATNDYDGDGLINLYEYGLGGDPTNALDQGTSPQYGITEQGGTTYFGYVYPQLSDSDSGLNYSLEVCTNLVDGMWTNAGYTVLGTNVTGEALNMVSNYTDTVDSQKFIRLIIEENQ